MGQELKNLNDIVEAAVRLFRSTQMTSWDAVEQVLDGLEDRQLIAIYRAADFPWCREAIHEGGDALVLIGVENLGILMRRRDSVRSADDRRSRRPEARTGAARRQNRRATSSHRGRRRR